MARTKRFKYHFIFVKYYTIIGFLSIISSGDKNTVSVGSPNLSILIDSSNLPSWIEANRTLPIKDIWEKVNAKLRGHFNYYGVSDNWDGLLKYRNAVKRLLCKWLRRRSQRSKLSWIRFNQLLKWYPLVTPKTLINLNSAYV
ncbi:hypothetical protein M8E35_12145 [Desulfosporosinus nitroreducens]|nr:hypothetical protein [Desulfosporosinus nitroreducens]